MDHKVGVVDEGQELVDDLGKGRKAREEVLAEAVDLEGFLGHVALGIDVALELRARFDVIDQLQAGDLDDAMSRGGIEASGLGIQNDFTHAWLSRIRRARPANSDLRAPPSS